MGLQRKVCDHPGCNELQCASDYNYKGKGIVMYRKWCQTHYIQRKANNAGFASINEYERDRNGALAKRLGFSNVTDYKNSTHPYLKYRKNYCENNDGSRGLGFTCNSTIVWTGQLDVDHKDENPTNNHPDNLQTLCKNCHAVKTNLFVKKHGRTPGRIALKVIKSNKAKTAISFDHLFEKCA
jgi:hypothetical protein